jgi:ribosomal protein S8
MMAILSENKKKEYPKSVTELLRLEEKGFVQGVSYFEKQNSNIYIKIKIRYVKNKKKQMYKILILYYKI